MENLESGSSVVVPLVRKHRVGSGVWMELSLQEVLLILPPQVPSLFTVLLSVHLALYLPLFVSLPLTAFSHATLHILPIFVNPCGLSPSTHTAPLLYISRSSSRAILCSFLRHLSPFEAGSSQLLGFRSAAQAPRPTSWQ